MTSKASLTVSVTCYRCEPGCGYNDGQEKVYDVLEAGTRIPRFVNPSEGVGSASWTAWDHEVAVNVNQIDDAALGVEMDFLKATVCDPGHQVWDWDSCSCSY